MCSLILSWSACTYHTMVCWYHFCQDHFNFLENNPLWIGQDRLCWLFHFDFVAHYVRLLPRTHAHSIWCLASTFVRTDNDLKTVCKVNKKKIISLSSHKHKIQNQPHRLAAQWTTSPHPITIPLSTMEEIMNHLLNHQLIRPGQSIIFDNAPGHGRSQQDRMAAHTVSAAHTAVRPNVTSTPLA